MNLKTKRKADWSEMVKELLKEDGFHFQEQEGVIVSFHTTPDLVPVHL